MPDSQIKQPLIFPRRHYAGEPECNTKSVWGIGAILQSQTWPSSLRSHTSLVYASLPVINGRGTLREHDAAVTCVGCSRSRVPNENTQNGFDISCALAGISLCRIDRIMPHTYRMSQ